MKKFFFEIAAGKAIATTVQTQNSVASVEVSFFRNPQRVSAEDEIGAELDAFNSHEHVTRGSTLRLLYNRERNNDRINQDPCLQESSVARYENVTEL